MKKGSIIIILGEMGMGGFMGGGVGGEGEHDGSLLILRG